MAKRVLHVTSSLSRGSGVMSVVMNYYRHISRENVQFDFMFFKDAKDSFGDEIEAMGGRAYLLPNPKHFIAMLRYLNCFFRENGGNFLAVHLHEVYLHSLVLPIARRYGIRHTIVHSHTTRYSDKKVNSIRNRVLCMAIRKSANHLMACSKAAAVFLYGDRAVAEGRVNILSNAIDPDEFRFSAFTREQVRNELQLSGRFVVGHVGRFSEPKNHIFLMKIFAELREKCNIAILMLVGEGPLKEDVLRVARELGLDDYVLFLGVRADVHRLMQAMDVFVLPSLHEGLPVIGVEAQAAGLPCIISDAVTEEIGITDLVVYKNLDLPPIKWADEILKAKGRAQRCDMSKRILDTGYDIRIESRKLEEYYLGLA